MIVGIDIGTQSLKVSVLDLNLRVRARSARSYRPSYPRPGWVEQDPGIWEDALRPAIAEALGATGASSSQVLALGLCGQLDGCIAVDRHCAPLSNCLTWMDRRASAEIADIPAVLIRRQCGLVLDPSHLAAKARWLKRHLAVDRPIARFHQPVSYLVERLTGVAVIDHALASTSMGYALDSCAYDPTLLDKFELSPEELPAIARSEDLAGVLTAAGAAVTGLPRGLPVAVGTGDDFAAPLGGGLVSPGRIAVVVGTGEVVGGVHATALRDDGNLVETHAYPGGAFFIENPGWLSGGALAWLASILGMTDFAVMDGLAAEVAPGAEGLTFIPALTGAMAPEWRPSARGCFYGLTPAHSRGHLIRAVMEGCAFAMRDVVTHMAEIGIAVNALLLLGGGARSRFWTQMRADIAGCAVEVPSCVDSAPIGAAILAAVAGGFVDNLATAAASLDGNSMHLVPDRTRRDAYEAAYWEYRRLFGCLAPFFENVASGRVESSLKRD